MYAEKLECKDYITQCWCEFTQLTPEERENLNRMEAYCKVKLSKKPRKKVLCISTGQVYNSLSECSEALGLNYYNLSAHCTKGKPITVKGYKFKYLT